MFSKAFLENIDGKVILRVPYVVKEQSAKNQRELNSPSELWGLAGNSNNDHRAMHPSLVRKDSLYNRNGWKSKPKRNFDEIDKASVSFGILNPLV